MIKPVTDSFNNIKMMSRQFYSQICKIIQRFFFSFGFFSTFLLSFIHFERELRYSERFFFVYNFTLDVHTCVVKHRF